MKEYWQKTFGIDPLSPTIGAVDIATVSIHCWYTFQVVLAGTFTRVQGDIQCKVLAALLFEFLWSRSTWCPNKSYRVLKLK